MSGLFAWIVLSVWMSKFLSCGRQTFLHKPQWIYWPNLSCRFRYSVGASMGQPDTRWSMVSVCLSHTLHFGSAPFSNMFAWKFLVGRLWSCAAMMKPSVSDFRPDEASQWWVSEKFKSESLARIEYLPLRGLSLHPSFSWLTKFLPVS